MNRQLIAERLDFMARVAASIYADADEMQRQRHYANRARAIAARLRSKEA